MTQTIEHFETIDSEHLEQLSTARDSLCVSIYMPTHRHGTDVQQDPIRLKNAVSTAKKQLVKAGLSESDADDLLQPARDLMNLDASDEFWQHQSDGLAILLSRDESCLFQLGTKFDEEVAVSHRYRLKPLLRSMNASEDFHLVAVSRNAVRVFRGCKSGLKEEHFDDLPAGLDEGDNDEQRGHNRHSFKVRANAADSSVPHGHVEKKDEEELKQYFRDIKEAVGAHLRAQDAPVVFAGVEELFPYFKDEFDCCPVLDEAVQGNFDDSSADDLLTKAWPVVRNHCDSERKAAVDRFGEASGTKHGSTDLKTIVQAAFNGRVDTLLLKHGDRNFGTCDDNGTVERSDEAASADTYDLYDIAAIRTLRADGRVVFVNDDQLKSPIAAIFRYVV
ncbi:hypothetical protein [Fuerstiella marisgermanici]|uniref:Uncharacterized protein n=1 Tax=Fuerstiella marisgermanici TaxID=1891926 RepID=A0A1P8WDW2_9PLAN|nr:hypothetical protein [Fuerstiella marisgermanici]APZ92242.1 hypothetical protein Fuma_01852 [Fuerstiella marisgermanici]